MDALAAGEGVAGGIPPDKVEITNCWPHEIPLMQRKTRRKKRLIITGHLKKPDYQVYNTPPWVA
jgi:hypothetical protein